MYVFKDVFIYLKERERHFHMLGHSLDDPKASAGAG